MIGEGRLDRLQQIHIEMPEIFLRINACPQDWHHKDYAVPTGNAGPACACAPSGRLFVRWTESASSCS